MASGVDFRGKSVERTYENLICVENESFNGLDENSTDLIHLQDVRGVRLPFNVSAGKDGILNITGTFKVKGTEFNLDPTMIGALEALRNITQSGAIVVDGGEYI